MLPASSAVADPPAGHVPAARPAPFVVPEAVETVDDWIRRCSQEDRRRRARLDFSPPVGERPTRWAPDPDWEIQLFIALDEVAAECVLRDLRRFGRRRRRQAIWVSTNSVGGLAGAGIAIYSLLREAVQQGFEVNVMVYGLGNSAASLIVQAASPGGRFMTLDAWMLIHAPYWSSPRPPTRDDRRQVRQMKRQFCEIYAARTGKTVDRLMRDTRRQLHMNAYQALAYGLVDHIEGLPLVPAAIGGGR